MFFETNSKSARQTEEIGKKFSGKLTGGDVLALEGDLGSGKTTFVKGLLRGLGIKKNVTSPTFLIIKKYEISKPKASIKELYHLDCYRLKNYKEILALGFGDILRDKSAVVAIEWAGKIKKALPGKLIEISFKWIDKNERKIIAKG